MPPPRSVTVTKPPEVVEQRTRQPVNQVFDGVITSALVRSSESALPPACIIEPTFGPVLKLQVPELTATAYLRPKSTTSWSVSIPSIQRRAMLHRQLETE